MHNMSIIGITIGIIGTIGTITGIMICIIQQAWRRPYQQWRRP